MSYYSQVGSVDERLDFEAMISADGISNGDTIVHSLDAECTQLPPPHHKTSVKRSHSANAKLWGELRHDVTDNAISFGTQSLGISADGNSSGILWKSQGDSYLNLKHRSAQFQMYRSSDDLSHSHFTTSPSFYHRRVNSAQRRKDFAASARKARSKNLNDSNSTQSHGSSSCTCCSYGSGISLDIDTRCESMESRHSMHSLPTKLYSSRESGESGFSFSIENSDCESPWGPCNYSPLSHHHICGHPDCCLSLKKCSFNQSMAESSEHGHRHRHRDRRHKRKHRRNKMHHSHSHVSLERCKTHDPSSDLNYSKTSHKHTSSHKQVCRTHNQLQSNSMQTTFHHKICSHYGCHSCACEHLSKLRHDRKECVYRENYSLCTSRRSSLRRSVFDESEENNHMQLTRNISEPIMIQARSESLLAPTIMKTSLETPLTTVTHRQICPLVRTLSDDSVKGHTSITDVRRPPWVDGDDIEVGIQEEVFSQLDFADAEEVNCVDVPSSVRTDGFKNLLPMRSDECCQSLPDVAQFDDLSKLSNQHGTSGSTPNSTYETNDQSTELANAKNIQISTIPSLSNTINEEYFYPMNANR